MSTLAAAEALDVRMTFYGCTLSPQVCRLQRRLVTELLEVCRCRDGMVSAVVFTSDRMRGLIWAHMQLWGPWLLVYTPAAA